MNLFCISFAFFSLVVMSAAERQCPLESDCMQNLCREFKYNPGAADLITTEEIPLKIQARCKNDIGKEIVTELDLRKCIGNFDGSLQWAPGGGENCNKCKVYQTNPEERSPIMLDCWECPTRDYFMTGNMWSVINLSYGIWVKDGVMGCYDHYGTRSESLTFLGPSPPHKRSRIMPRT
ncbi:hypothetical protein C8034_v004765 [Colletotrichum sidae]|uniref:Cyanovirin-N domain-containing protein n=1 Tax=Colletotrichum sidae TaxID=1347389 RepID=A0A4R8T6X8_9PEZI|nr:hypothetical protein C8034_v004765 [Colletotrichum sidae]